MKNTEKQKMKEKMEDFADDKIQMSCSLQQNLNPTKILA